MRIVTLDHVTPGTREAGAMIGIEVMAGDIEIEAEVEAGRGTADGVPGAEIERLLEVQQTIEQ
jgi:hypothetical protein